MHVSVISTPSFPNAATARRSSSTIQPGCFKTLTFVKSVPRGSVIVGTRTRALSLARDSSHATPASPRLSVSAMMCACVTGTKSAAPKNSPTLIWCSSALFAAALSSPACIERSRSFSFTVLEALRLGRKVGVTLLAQRGEALLHLGTGKAEHFERELGVERRSGEPQPVVERVLRPAQRGLRPGGELAGDFERFRLQFGFFTRQGNQAN